MNHTPHNIFSTFIIIFLFSLPLFPYAQETAYPKSTTSVIQSSDTLKLIEIVSAMSLRQITVNDSTVLETVAGKAEIKQGKTFLKGDSIIINKKLGTAEAFGNIHIIDSNSVHTYAQYVKYLGNEKIAYLKNNVILHDGKSELQTNELEYNLSTGIATYKSGGKVRNGKTILESREGIYYSKTSDVFFNGNVRMKDPKYSMKAESLQYNSSYKIVYFISPTKITSKDGTIETTSGNYNTETGDAVFLEKTVFKDGNRYVRGNKMSIDEKKGTILIEDDGKVVDNKENVIIFGDQILIDKKNNNFLATRKPVMIFYRDNDSTYISADTLYSGKKKTGKSSEAQKVSAADDIRFFSGFRNVKIFNDSLQALCDSLYYSSGDSTFKLMQNPVCWNNNSQIKGDTIHLVIQNQKAKELRVPSNASMINQTKEGFLNQISGKSLQADFINGDIHKATIKGNPAESIFYPQDDDSAYVGMNYNQSDMIEIFFVNKNLNKVKYINNLSGTMYPMRMIPADKKLLKNSIWLNSKRPASKMELFE